MQTPEDLARDIERAASDMAELMERLDERHDSLAGEMEDPNFEEGVNNFRALLRRPEASEAVAHVSEETKQWIQYSIEREDGFGDVLDAI